MTQTREILKIGLAVIENGRLLMVKKKGAPSFILPGGKPNPGESDMHALVREVDEELGCGIDVYSVRYLGAFSAPAADLPGLTVTVKLYTGKLTGSPVAQAEIESLHWSEPNSKDDQAVAPSLRDHILPFLENEGLLVPAEATRAEQQA